MTKLDATGKHLWSKQIAFTQTPKLMALAAEPAGGVVLSCSFSGAASLGNQKVTSVGFTDGLLLKLDASGSTVWMKSFPGSGNHYPEGVVADAGGNILLTGTFNGTMTFGGTLLSSVSPVEDLFLAKLDPSGSTVWAQRFGGAGTTSVFGTVAVDGAGNAVLAGAFVGTIDLGLGPLVSAGNSDVFTAKFGAAAGAPLWAKRFGDASTQQAQGIAIDGVGDELITGIANGTIDFGGNALMTMGGGDLFVAKLAP